MPLKDLELVAKVGRIDDLPRAEKPEVAIVGRSNVGKSTLINALSGRRALAGVGKRPGHTRALHIYRGGRLALVDLPGYGYAEVSKKLRAGWGELIESYLSEREALRGVLLVIDARHGPTPLDLQMWDWLMAHALPVRVVATKWDLVKASRRPARLAAMQEALPTEVTPFSGKTGAGKRELARIVLDWAT